MNRTAAQHNTYYQRLLKAFRNAAAFMPFVMVPFGLLARTDLVDSRFYSGDLVFALITAIYICISLIYFYITRRWQSIWIDIIFMTIFHLLTLCFVLFVSGFLSAFLSVWIVLMISSDLYFGSRGFLASFSALCIAGSLSVIVHPEMPIGEKFEVLQGALVVGAIGYVISRIRKITDHERTALARTREQETFQRERLLALVNSMGDAVVTTNEQGSIKVYNAALLSLLDTNSSLTGKKIDDILQLKDRGRTPVSLIHEAQTIHKVFSRTDLSLTFPDGEQIKLYVNVAPIKPGYQSHAEQGYIIILRDITKEKTLEEERDEFISVVSHELRTPIAIAEGNLSNMQVLQAHGAAPEVMRKAVDDAHEQILYLSKMVNDLSTLSRAERGLNSEKEAIDPTALLNDLYSAYLPEADKKGLKFNLDIRPKLPMLYTSRLYLEEIMQNLLTNAIKYTKEGSVTLIGRRTQAGDVYIAVKDTGIGISKSDQKRIFEKFYRSEDYRTRESTGTGLGLYVSRKLAAKLGTDITFESRLNHGSTFSIVLKAGTEAEQQK